jgi:ATP-dependent DNA helicase RecG
VSQSAIHCGRFKKETIIIDDRMIEGTFIEQINEAMDFIRKNINVEFVMTGRPECEQVWDYTISSNVEIRIYNDRLIVGQPLFTENINEHLLSLFDFFFLQSSCLICHY